MIIMDLCDTIHAADIIKHNYQKYTAPMPSIFSRPNIWNLDKITLEEKICWPFLQSDGLADVRKDINASQYQIWETITDQVINNISM